MQRADLHLHTIYSDGDFTPEQLVQEAIKANLSCIAVTDHDCILGVKPAREAAGESLEVIPAIELTAEQDSSEIHILGYFVDENSEELNLELEKLRKVRIQRIYDMTEKLNKIAIDVSAEDVFKKSKYGCVGRLHIAQVLLEKGHVSNMYEAFNRYIGDKAPCYVGKFSLNPKEAIDLIIRAKGIPVLAHPYVLRNDSLIASFIECGIKGLEIYYPEHSQLVVHKYLAIAKKFGLCVTGGSDFHGDVKPHIKVGQISIPYKFVERLKKERYG